MGPMANSTTNLLSDQEEDKEALNGPTQLNPTGPTLHNICNVDFHSSQLHLHILIMRANRIKDL